MSGYTADVATRSGDIDMERLLQKPFTLPELARAVRQVLTQRPITS
jgi:CheY-like chemotaxis protein